jgi:acetyl-CoA carboxylase biotin carboxyl carrier protein
VSPDSTVCIVEAMKVMNEIKADCKGKIVEILKENSNSVLTDEAILIIEKS